MIAPTTPRQVDRLARSWRVNAVILATEMFGLSPTVSPAADGGDPLWDLSLEELGRIQIVTPSKVPERLAKSAATVSVIGADEIRRSAARTVYDVLRAVPGLTVGTGNFGDTTLTVRGIHTTFSEKVLIMQDGHVLNDSRSGSATFQFLDRLPVDNIDRIEVVRSPGSALYGANAMLAVINIITRQADAVGGWQASASTEWDRQHNVANRYNLLYGGVTQDWKVVTNLQVVHGDGPTLPVAADALGYAGDADTRERSFDFQTVLDDGSWRLGARYLRRTAGDYFGILNVLNDQSSQQVQYGFLDLQYRTTLAAGGDLTVRAYADHQDTDNYYVGLPAGSIPVGHPLFAWNATGVIGETRARENAAGAEIRFDRQVQDAHRISIGAAWRRERLYDPQLHANFNPAPLPSVQDVSDVYNWINTGSRNVVSGYLQDLWDLSAVLRLTLGVRYDHFNDFGSSFNPRLGLNWQINPRMDMRLTYGSAFRAPDFVSLYVKNNPIAVGNPDLRPEEAKTTEAGLTVNLTDRWQVAGVLFHTELRQLIDQAPAAGTYQNLGSARVSGIELETRHRLGRRLDWRASYTFSDSEFTDASPFAVGPRHSGNMVADVALSQALHWQVQAYAQAETARSAVDGRVPLPGYAVVNTSVTATVNRTVELQVAVFNLIDQRYRYPSAPSTVPGDYPAPGRSILLGLRARL